MKPILSESAALPLEAFGKCFLDMLNRTKGQICKIEKRQEYGELPGLISYGAYKRKEFDIMWKDIHKLFENQIEIYGSLAKNRVAFERIRLIKRPLTDYLKYEFLTYDVGTRYGERVLIADVTENEIIFNDSEDCLIFDGTQVLINRFSDDGLPLGGWYLDKPSDVQFFLNLASNLYRIVTPLGYFEENNGGELNKLARVEIFDV